MRRLVAEANVRAPWKVLGDLLQEMLSGELLARLQLGYCCHSGASLCHAVSSLCQFQIGLLLIKGRVLGTQLSKRCIRAEPACH